MRDLVILNSSTVIPPNPTPPHHHHHHHKPKPSLLNPTKLPSSKHPPISTVHSSSPLPTTIRQDLTTTTRHESPLESPLKYYADLASNLAADGRLNDFLMIAETVLVNGFEPSRFVASLNVGLVSKGISGVLREGKIWSVVEVLRSVEKLGISALGLFDGSAIKMLAKECRRIVDCGEVEEAVELMEILAGFHFSIKKLVEPHDVIKICIEKCNPEMAVSSTGLI